jgi:hypothetical protein
MCRSKLTSRFQRSTAVTVGLRIMAIILKAKVSVAAMISTKAKR